MEIRVECSLTGEGFCVDVAADDTVASLAARVGGLYYGTTTTTTATSRPPPQLLRRTQASDGIAMPLGSDSTPIRSTGLCEGDILIAVSTTIETSWKKPASYRVRGNRIALSHCGVYCLSACSHAKTATLVNLAKGKTSEPHMVRGVLGVLAMAVTDQYIAYSVYGTKCVSLLRREGFGLIHEFSCSADVTSLAGTPNGEYFISTSGIDGCKVFESATARCVKEDQDFTGAVASSPNGGWLAFGGPRVMTAALPRLTQCFFYTRIDRGGEPVFSHDSTMLAIPNEKRAEVYNVNGALRCAFVADEEVRGLAFTADGLQLYVTTWGGLQVVDPLRGQGRGICLRRVHTSAFLCVPAIGCEEGDDVVLFAFSSGLVVRSMAELGGVVVDEEEELRLQRFAAIVPIKQVNLVRRPRLQKTKPPESGCQCC